MADIKVSQMGEVLVASDNDLLNLVSYDDQNQTYVSGKVKASTLKSYMVDDMEVSDLYDTTITTPTDDDGLVYDATAQKWKNKPVVTGDLWVKNGAHNLLPNSLTTQVINGVTFTVNSDKSITISGSPTTLVAPIVGANFTIPKGQYILSGIDSSVTNMMWNAIVLLNGASVVHTYTISSKDDFSFDTSAYTYTNIQVSMKRIEDNVACSGTIYPMIRLASDTDPTYAPYAKTNRELTDDTSIKFYDLSSAKGTNVTFLSASAVKLGDMVFLQGHWTGSNNSSDIILTVPQELNPKATKVYGYGMAKFSTGYVAGEYSLKNSAGYLYQSISSSAGTEGEFSVIYSISKSTT